MISRDVYIAMFSMTFNQHKVKCDHSALGASGVDRLTQHNGVLVTSVWAAVSGRSGLDEIQETTDRL